jgi:hypothetical protein
VLEQKSGDMESLKLRLDGAEVLNMVRLEVTTGSFWES